ncbi:tRNA N(3)-cytidine methyltransferase METTL6-like [Amphiura filiformis]|uniref:tRNA N(3)-cytidine methyltransferase METTL6-like n=1 Tax=Amphiura filiformis TaxID=82378 RepID=UPI003B21C5F4
MSHTDYPFQATSSGLRELTEVEKRKLADDKEVVSEFKQNKLEKEAQRNWDLFYKRNSVNFFKDRHWTTREFEELAGITEGSTSETPVLLEVGCGVGNALYPLIAESKHLYVHACDFSPRAVQFVKDNAAYDPHRINAFQCDLTKDDLVAHIPECNVDVVTMLFVLSAVHPDKMIEALQNVHKVVRPGGCVLFRDYGLYDHAMLRFAKGHKLMDNFYVRQDGTRAYYFTKEFLNQLFVSAGFKESTNDYVLRQTVNKKEGISVPRVFVQAKFTKPDHR